MQCPCGGAAALVRDTRDITIGGITIEAITADYCPACGEGILDRSEGDRYAKALAQARREQ